MGARWVIWGSAVLAGLSRYPGLFWPVRPDEAGFTLVARAWHPQPDSLYGTYWVDRPPSLIAFFGLSDLVGGPLFVRWVAAVGCVALVLLAAALTRAVGRSVGRLAAGELDRAAAWVAVATAGLVGNAAIDPTAAKGEILGIPLLLLSFLLAVRALARPSPLLAFGAGLSGVLAAALKQNMVSGLLFGGVVLVVSLLRKELTGRQFGALAGAAAVGAAIPVAATIAWAEGAGVRLSTLGYAVYGFRFDAADVLASEPSNANAERADELLLLAVVTGMVFVAAWFLLQLVPLLRRAPALTLGALAALALDTVGVAVSGSFWSTYLFVLIPSLVVCLALLLTTREPRSGVLGVATTGVGHGIAVYVAGAAVVSLVVWGIHNIGASSPGHAVRVGAGIGAASEPGDTIVVYGGRPDVVMASGLSSPYPYLWSLPMRTLDPHLAALRTLLSGDRAPTWVVQWVGLDTWDPTDGAMLRPILQQRYVEVGTGCDESPIYRLRTADRPTPHVDCDSVYWPFSGVSGR